MPQDESKKLILVVDDEESARKLERMLLEREGYRVIAAPHGGDGLVLAKAERPDVILLDLLMPAIGGHEVIRRLKADPDTRDIPVIVLTAKGAEKDIAISFQLGALFHMEKPYEIKDLLQKVKVALVRAAEGGSGGKTESS